MSDGFHSEAPGLFQEVAGNRGLHGFDGDGKRLADASPKPWVDYAALEEEFERGRDDPTFSAGHLLLVTHDIPGYDQHDHMAIEPSGLPIDQHIENTWELNTYHELTDKGSLIGTPYPHLKPGSRFSEGYYSDLHLGLQGLAIAARTDPSKHTLIEGVLQNCANAIERFGCIPNGWRTYYGNEEGGRSQIPKFTSMVRDRMSDDDTALERFLPYLQKEHAWWTKGDAVLIANHRETENDHSVRMPDGSILHRYWDPSTTPRPESYQEDIETAMRIAGSREPEEVFRDLRAAAESGRDFTAMQLENPERLETIRTTRIVPPDLNALLWQEEMAIAEALSAKGERQEADRYYEMAQARLEAMNSNLLNHRSKAFGQFIFERGMHEGELDDRPIITATYPVTVGMAEEEQAVGAAQMLEEHFLKRGGFVGSIVGRNEQWDSNGWAPDQVEAAAVFDVAAQQTGDTRFSVIARDARRRWVNTIETGFEHTRQIWEKYKVEREGDDPARCADGEYVNQPEFLWTKASHVVSKDRMSYPA